MKKTLAVYSLSIAAAAFALQWLQYKYVIKVIPSELYIVLIAVAFTVLGIWLGHRLTAEKTTLPVFERNQQALGYLRISEREYEVLELLAAGQSNKEIAANLFVSPNTVKTHLANLYGKLEVSRRTQAVQRARELRLIP